MRVVSPLFCHYIEYGGIMALNFSLALPRRRMFGLLLGLLSIIILLSLWNWKSKPRKKHLQDPDPVIQPFDDTPKPPDPPFSWADVAEKYPLSHFRSLPSANQWVEIPKIQYNQFPVKDAAARKKQKERLAAVKGNFTHAWNGYKKHAWMKDEVSPISGGFQDSFGGWAATLVDALGTLWIMNMKKEFKMAVDALQDLDFTECALEELNVFETTIRHLGGLLSAYDLTEGKYPILLRKAKELGDTLYKAFDTPNRMPLTRWNFNDVKEGLSQEASSSTLVAEIGSLTLEFTRLSQVTGDPRYYDAVQRIMDIFDVQQSDTNLPGMWPISVDAASGQFNKGDIFTIGGMADSLYEYLPKQYILLGGASPQYRKLYEEAMKPMRQNIFYRPMTPNSYDILFAGEIISDGAVPTNELRPDPQAQHLSCFAGGMVALGSKIFDIKEDLEIARKLVEGCLWGYETALQGIMPEIIHTVACDEPGHCKWDEKKWLETIAKAHQEGDNVQTIIDEEHLTPGVTRIDDSRYILRPEAIESVWYLYRITGDPSYQDRAWNMFESITKATTTDIAHAALDDCADGNLPKADRMESFWLAETLRYFYLIFEDPDTISLDEYVLNTEAHPLRRRN